MAPSDAYASAGSGKLKLKGVKDSKIDKKKKKKSSSSKPREEGEEGAATEASPNEFKDRSVMLKKLEEEDEALAGEQETSLKNRRKDHQAEGDGRQDEEEEGESFKTEAERRYEEQRRRRLEERLKREGVKTHKERVEELNRYLSGLSEHHDMPRIGPG